MLADVEVLVPASADEAIAAFGDGSGVTVVGGGTIVMPEITSSRLRPSKAVLLGKAGLAGVTQGEGRVTIGATTPVSALEDGDEPLATAARHVADIEVRAQATVAGNLCTTASGDAPRGDLQGPLLALGAMVRSAGAGGERTEPLEEFLAGGASGRLMLDVSYESGADKTGYAAAWRPHTHHYTILAVSAVQRGSATRIAAVGVGRTARLLDANDPLAGLDLPDDALASAWYRAKLLPTLVERALANLEEA